MRLLPPRREENCSGNQALECRYRWTTVDFPKAESKSSFEDLLPVGGELETPILGFHYQKKPWSSKAWSGSDQPFSRRNTPPAVHGTKS